ncbi:ComEA family DNA-binding protein [Staphylococcus carnosus]|uniref:ComEA protein n=2 Tax=Staphylococcus carnosus TaxID=1281 RepID=A0AAJ0JQG1_STACA|nr:ComEA family DNA-binding protein [Staphylococcus carnosus]KKB26139.1 comEA protein [Staphylococcus carnosus]QQS85106.1 helix-hairpin-helix domain-containing protein [Staphylococcus carnosus]QRQ05046.1 helix-hairpin-helix domain-containing protein [Staphylococcus carnosus]UTB82960.1 comEA protein [Staphylococcus carnosus]UTC00387.1 comEA protein [Staphylococcus carnosus]
MLEKLKLYIENYKQYRYLIIILVLLVIILLIFIKPDESSTKIEEKSNVDIQGNTDKKYPNDGQPASKKSTDSYNKSKKVMVDIKGAVKHPNVYEMSDTQRVKDVLSKAIPTEKADLNLINLSEKLVDHKMIYIPEKGKETTIRQASISSGTTSSISTNQQKVNVNTAKESELTSITGLGPTKAKAIIEYRENKGSFNKIEQLKEIKGFGDKTYEKLKDYLTV